MHSFAVPTLTLTLCLCCVVVAPGASQQPPSRLLAVTASPTHALAAHEVRRYLYAATRQLCDLDVDPVPPTAPTWPDDASRTRSRAYEYTVSVVNRSAYPGGGSVISQANGTSDFQVRCTVTGTLHRLHTPQHCMLLSLLVVLFRRFSSHRALPSFHCFHSISRPSLTRPARPPFTRAARSGTSTPLGCRCPTTQEGRSLLG